MWKARLLTTFLERVRGLMFKRSVEPLLFEFDREGIAQTAIHSLFCPVFDAVFLDSGKRVVSVIPRIPPYKLFITPAKPARFLLELPPGESRKVREGEKLSWNERG